MGTRSSPWSAPTAACADRRTERAGGRRPSGSPRPARRAAVTGSPSQYHEPRIDPPRVASRSPPTAKASRTSAMKLSFCTTCMGRAHHLKQTLPRNLADSVDWSRPDAVEFVVLDYSSPDDLAEWITTDPRLAAVPRRRHLEVRPVRGPAPLPALPRQEHGPRAGHRRLRLQRRRRQLRRLRLRRTTCGRSSAAGRTRSWPPTASTTGSTPASTRAAWAGSRCPGTTSHLLGGYDESERFKGWSGEDSDLLIRAVRKFMRPVFLRDRRFLRVSSTAISTGSCSPSATTRRRDRQDRVARRHQHAADPEVRGRPRRRPPDRQPRHADRRRHRPVARPSPQRLSPLDRPGARSA